MKQDELKLKAARTQIEHIQKTLLYLIDIEEKLQAEQREKMEAQEKEVQWKPDRLSIHNQLLSLSSHGPLRADLEQQCYLYQLALHLNKGWTPDWSDKDQEKWDICYDHQSQCWLTAYARSCDTPGTTYFKDETAANKAVEIVKNEPLMML